MKSKKQGKTLREMFYGFVPGSTLNVDVDIGGFCYNGSCVYAGKSSDGVLLIPAIRDGDGINYKKAFVVNHPEQVKHIEVIPPLLEHFGLPIYGKRKSI